VAEREPQAVQASAGMKDYTPWHSWRPGKIDRHRNRLAEQGRFRDLPIRQRREGLRKKLRLLFYRLSPSGALKKTVKWLLRHLDRLVRPVSSVTGSTSCSGGSSSGGRSSADERGRAPPYLPKLTKVIFPALGLMLVLSSCSSGGGGEGQRPKKPNPSTEQGLVEIYTGAAQQSGCSVEDTGVQAGFSSDDAANTYLDNAEQAGFEIDKVFDCSGKKIGVIIGEDELSAQGAQTLEDMVLAYNDNPIDNTGIGISKIKVDRPSSYVESDFEKAESNALSLFSDSTNPVIIYNSNNIHKTLGFGDEQIVSVSTIGADTFTWLRAPLESTEFVDVTQNYNDPSLNLDLDTLPVGDYAFKVIAQGEEGSTSMNHLISRSEQPVNTNPDIAGMPAFSTMQVSENDSPISLLALCTDKETPAQNIFYTAKNENGQTIKSGYFENGISITVNPSGQGGRTLVRTVECEDDGTPTGQPMSAKGTWRVSVQNYTPPNHAPVFDNVPGSLSVDENSLLEFTIHATDPDGDKVTYSVSNLPAGAVFDSQTGVFSWTPSYNQSGVYNIGFVASDGSLTDEATTEITVNDVNRAPVYNGLDKIVFDEATPHNGSISASDPDGDSVSCSKVSGPAWFSVNADCTYNVNAGYDEISHPSGYNGEQISQDYNIEVLVSDNKGADTTGSTQVTLNDVDRLSTITVSGLKSIYNEGDDVNIQIYISDPDGDVYTPTITGDTPQGTGADAYPNHAVISGTMGPNAGDCAGGLCSYSNTISVPGASKTVDYVVNDTDPF